MGKREEEKRSTIKPIPLQDPGEMFDDWDNLEVDNIYRDLAEGYKEMSDQNLKDAEHTFAVQAEILRGNSMLERKFENCIDKSLKKFKRDIIGCYAVLTITELIVIYYILLLS